MSQEAQTFYSVTPGLALYAGKTSTVLVDGRLTYVDPPLVRFTPLGSASVEGKKYGYYTTSDPDIIAFLNARAAQGLDVITAEEFNRRMMPAEMGRKMAEEEATRLRAENNRLLAMLEELRKPKVAAQK